MLIDTHAHLYAEQFDQDRAAMIDRAKLAGIEKILLPNIDSASVDGMLQMSRDYPEFCYPMMGLHPCSVQEGFENDLEEIYEKLHREKIIAIGEIGIDLYWDKSTLELQRLAFRAQVQWAKTLNLPIVIHARDSYNELFEELNKLNDDSLRGVFHCFTGSQQQAEKILSYGNFYLGLGGVLTYKNSGIANFIAHLPLDRIILETDAPYLPPVPHRGKRNESAYVKFVAERLSEIFQVSLEEIGQQTSQNAKRLFDL
jgi:TatD DNase family protein